MNNNENIHSQNKISFLIKGRKINATFKPPGDEEAANSILRVQQMLISTSYANREAFEEKAG